MYLYFLPLPTSSSSTNTSPLLTASATPALPNANLEPDEIVIPTPTPDGGIEHTAARFLPPSKWLALARANRIMLFPPQFFLLNLLAPYLAPTITSHTSAIPPPSELQAERDALQAFLAEKAVYEGVEEPSWAEACISPRPLGEAGYGDAGKGVAVLGLDWAGAELEGSGRKGIRRMVVMARFKKEGPRDVEIVGRDEALGRDARL
jgi:hypothetical protein